MTWSDPRGDAFTAGRFVHGLADDHVAKSRRDESAVRSTRGRSVRHTRRLLAVGGGALAVVVVVAAVAVASQDDNEPTAAGPAGVAAPGGSASAEPTGEPTPTVDPVAEVEATSPQGVYRVTVSKSIERLRGGSTQKVAPGEPTRWTFAVAGCTPDGCTGTINSSSGKVYHYTWSDGTLRLDPLVVENPKTACVDSVTGEVQPINESAWKGNYSYEYDPFTGTTDRLSGIARWRVTNEKFFGRCQAADDDPMSGRFVVTMRRK